MRLYILCPRSRCLPVRREASCCGQDCIRRICLSSTHAKMIDYSSFKDIPKLISYESYIHISDISERRYYLHGHYEQGARRRHSTSRNNESVWSIHLEHLALRRNLRSPRWNAIKSAIPSNLGWSGLRLKNAFTCQLFEEQDVRKRTVQTPFRENTTAIKRW